MIVLFNARIYTQSPCRPFATAIAINNDRIIALGNDDEMRELARSPQEQQNMHGYTIFPGFWDAHIHLGNYACSLGKVNCETPSRQACIDAVHQRKLSVSPGEWILGHGWNQNVWQTGFGDRRELDAISPANPVYLTAKSLHAGWANSLALVQAGITAKTPDPIDGKILRDKNGEPTGILLESAMKHVESAIPKPSVSQLAERIKSAQRELWTLGITGVHDFDGEDCFAALQSLDDREELQLRVSKSLPRELLPHACILKLRFGFGSQFLRIGYVKLFADGALGPQTAAMLDPYETSASHLGMLLMTEEEILEHGRQAVQIGLPLAVHAIGDRANRTVLNAYAKLRAFEGHSSLPPLPHRIEHVQLIYPADLTALVNHHITASMQPIHATSDQEMADLHWGKRVDNAYAWKSILQAGANLVFGSDAPVESPNPFWGLHASVTRTRQDHSQPWHPEQHLTLTDSISSYTVKPAALAGFKSAGSLQAGAFADLIVLERDPYQVSPQDLYRLLPNATMVAGRWMIITDL